MNTHASHPDAARTHSAKLARVSYDGFPVRKEDVSRARHQLNAVSSLTRVQRQFVGTMLDTEAAVGYFMGRRKTSGHPDPTWIAYMSVKMKREGDLKVLAGLIGHRAPSRSRSSNTITRTLDLRWSVQAQGLVAYALVKRVRPFLFNEKAIVETDCMLEFGPIVQSGAQHPFERSGAVRVRRGVWFWPQIEVGGRGRHFVRTP